MQATRFIQNSAPCFKEPLTKQKRPDFCIGSTMHPFVLPFTLAVLFFDSFSSDLPPRTYLLCRTGQALYELDKYDIQGPTSTAKVALFV